jgi:methylphosphotriester-DNA--protein-cysteine methyltransferase
MERLISFFRDELEEKLKEENVSSKLEYICQNLLSNADDALKEINVNDDVLDLEKTVETFIKNRDENVPFPDQVSDPWTIEDFRSDIRKSVEALKRVPDDLSIESVQTYNEKVRKLAGIVSESEEHEGEIDKNVTIPEFK